MIKDSRSYEYAQFCIKEGNRKVPKYVKLQAQSWLDIVDGKDPDAYMDETTLGKINKLLKLMVHPDLLIPMDEGLEDYACLLIDATLCTKLKKRG